MFNSTSEEFNPRNTFLSTGKQEDKENLPPKRVKFDETPMAFILSTQTTENKNE